MRNFQRAALGILVLLCSGVGWAQSNETFSAGSGGTYDASVCNDPQIPITAAQQNATPYHDPNWNTPGDPLVEALRILAQEYNNDNIDLASACAHAPGVVFFVPTNLTGQVTKLIGQIETTQPGGDTYNGSGNTPANNTPTKNGGGPGNNGGGGGPGNNRGGGPPPNYNPMPGPAGGIGYQPGPDPCLPKGKGGYNYCDNGPGAHLPAGCFCNTVPPPPPPAVSTRKIAPKVQNTVPDTLKYTAGVVNGLGNCAQGMVDLVAAAGYIARGAVDLQAQLFSMGKLGTEAPGSAPFVQAAKLLGLQPGQSLVLKQIAQESQTQVIEVNGKPADPYTGGTAAAQRICLYGLIPRPAKAGGRVPGSTAPAGAPPIEAPGTIGTRPMPAPVEPGTLGTQPMPQPGTLRTRPTTPPGEPGSPGTVQAGSPGTRPVSENGVPRAVPPIDALEGATPGSAVGGTRLRAVVSDNGTAPSLAGRWIQTGQGPTQLGNFVGKGEFGAVYEKGGNPNQVIKVGTNLPETPASFNEQVGGGKLLKGVDNKIAPDILENTPPQNGQPPVMVLDNVFRKPGAFQATSRGTARTQATIDSGTPTTSLPKLTPAQTRQVPIARQQLIDKIAGGGLIAGDLHGGNIVYVSDGAGGLTGVVVDSDLVGTRAGLVKELNGREGSDILGVMSQAQANGVTPPVSRLMQSIVNVLEAGNGDLSVLNPNMTPLSVMNALEESRQNIAQQAAQAAQNRAAGGGVFSPGI